MKIVEFVQQSGRYNAGNIAGFDDVLADEYIRRGIARLHRDGKPYDTIVSDKPEEVAARAAASPSVSDDMDAGFAVAAASAATQQPGPAGANPEVTFATVELPDDEAIKGMDKMSLIEIAGKIRSDPAAKTKTEAIEVINAERERRRIANEQ